jgi:hypothetical protein
MYRGVTASGRICVNYPKYSAESASGMKIRPKCDTIHQNMGRKSQSLRRKRK